MTPPEDKFDLPASVAAAIGELDGVTERAAGSSTEYRRGPQLFAVVDSKVVELRLRPDIAVAILRTPETEVSKRGGEWIRFAPTSMDPSVGDRLAAWVTTAWRAAGG